MFTYFPYLQAELAIFPWAPSPLPQILYYREKKYNTSFHITNFANSQYSITGT